MNYKLLFLASLGFSVLVGCSGTSETSATDSVSRNLVAVTDDGLDPETNPSAFLTASEEFEFKSNFAMGLDVNINSSDRAFFQVCTEFEGTALGAIDIDYDSCVIRTPLDAGTFNGEIPITNDKTQLVAEIWFYDENSLPKQYLYEVTDRNNSSWIIR